MLTSTSAVRVQHIPAPLGQKTTVPPHHTYNPSVLLPESEMIHYVIPLEAVSFGGCEIFVDDMTHKGTTSAP